MKADSYLMSACRRNYGLRGVFVAVSCFALVACGGGSSSSDSSPSTYTVTAIADNGGSISPEAATVAEGESMAFTVTPETHYNIADVSGCGGSLSGSTYTTGAITADCDVIASFYADPVTFTDGQAANVVIQNGFGEMSGSPDVVDGVLYLPDTGNKRVLGFNVIPTSNGASADFVLGASDLFSVGTLGAMTVTHYNNQFFVADFSNSLIAVYDPIPSTDTSAAFTLTVPGKGGLSSPRSVAVAGDKLAVSDSANHRVLIWNTVPTTDTDPDLVLGQADFTGTSANRGGAVAASTLNWPAGVWTDGQRLVVNDNSNHRVLIWNTFPTENGQAADLVLGQTGFTSNAANQGGSPSASTLRNPYDGVYVSGDQLYVVDALNNRVLIWNNWPTANGQAADNVLGQADFTTVTSGSSNAALNYPVGLVRYGARLIVGDSSNSRYLIFNGSY